MLATVCPRETAAYRHLHGDVMRQSEAGVKVRPEPRPLPWSRPSLS